ncbi:DivIVA domain-containing protein [Microtetraspora sp. AC03309]|uniref:DivIVA domain-containing protein n=1 Tax=Microtetraspora sp. AC03309 TaxID=2779376 RepID=UPI001E3E01FD|nr:DivIVA domain-containing protein [Microtetraspora sp. AC03309]MCC5574983.1 DivIVA domain-containing protein [Microtetraspora sp. AC03309]
MNRFPRVRGVRLGYDPAQVDDLVHRIEGTLGRTELDGPPITADEIRSAAFRVRRGGYNETAVDFALDAFVVAVEALASRTPAPPGPVVSDPVVSEPVLPDPVVSEPVLPVVSDSMSSPGSVTPGSVVEAAPPVVVETAESAAHEASHDQEIRTVDPALPDSRTAGRDGEVGWGDGGFEAQAERIERVAFRPGRLGMGYDEDEVDAFLDRVVATLRGTAHRPVTSDQVRKATFATVVFKTGYAIADVDAFLAEIADDLERRA